MVPADTAQGPAAHVPVDLRKRTDRELTDMWCQMTLAIDGLKGPRDEIGKLLRERALKSGKRFYKASAGVDAKGIAMERTTTRQVPDTEALRAYLADKYDDFLKRTKAGWTLKLLQ